MKITILGCGNAFISKNYNACYLLEEDNRKMLIDCGYLTGLALENAGISEKDITDIYISHQHADHIGYLEPICLGRYDFVNKPAHWTLTKNPITLYANDGLMNELWEKSLQGGLKSVEGLDATLETFFKPYRIKSNEKFMWCGWSCELIQQIHIMTGSVIMPTFGIFLTKPGHKSIYFTTDSQYCSPKQVEVFYKRADVIFQDCECIGVDTTEKKSIFLSGVHANYAQLAGYETANSQKLSADIKSKMWLSHYQYFVTEHKDNFGNTIDWFDMAIRDGFSGFVSVGQVFEY